jgi:hypothetical protein
MKYIYENKQTTWDKKKNNEKISNTLLNTPIVSTALDTKIDA